MDGDRIIDALAEEYCARHFSDDHMFEPKEKSEITDIFKKAIKGENEKYAADYKPLKQHLDEHINSLELEDELDQDDIDGFVVFRIKIFEKELDNLMGHVTEDFLVDREYIEFIKLLKYYVDLQEPKGALVVDFREDGFDITDEAGKSIYDEMMSEFKDNLHTMGDSVMNPDDALVSVLVTAAPTKLTLKNKQYCKAETLNTIQAIFANRIVG